MAITNASRLADFGSGIGTAGAAIQIDNANQRVGIGTTNPRFTLEVGAVGASGTTLFVNGDARVTGIVTIGPASITLNGITNIINVGTGLTLDGNTGVISATTFFGNGANLSGISVNRFLSVTSRVGIVSVTAFAGILTVFGRASNTNVFV